ncbi:hypothetical protein [Campylobacter helveticus]|uniref:hypothetical protein n=1 Tax=Campylobacter helveticus TaxID=28898 RepID=UPI0022EAC676|nr:hypothetical protein [Campylobacter helveticus]
MTRDELETILKDENFLSITLGTSARQMTIEKRRDCFFVKFFHYPTALTDGFRTYPYNPKKHKEQYPTKEKWDEVSLLELKVWIAANPFIYEEIIKD